MTSMLPEKIKETIDEFQTFDLPEEKYELLLEHAKVIGDYPDELRNTKHLVPGCISVVYIDSQIQDDKVYFQGSADALLVKGLVAILVNGLSGMQKEDFLKLSPDFITEFGVNENLTPSRANASHNIFKFMQKQVAALDTKPEQ